MTISSDMAAMAYRLLSREGQVVTLSLQDIASGGDYDPSTGINTPSTPVTHSVKAVKFDSSVGTQALVGTIVSSADSVLYMLPANTSGVSFRKPSPTGDKVILASGESYRVKLVQEYNISNSPIMYILSIGN